jgi:uncharacterized protein DUF3224
MTAHADGTFTVASWDETTYQELEGKAKLTRARVGFRLDGDLAGDASWEALMCYREDGTAEYTGLQQFTGQLAGRSGTCVMVADGTYSDGEARSAWRVIPGSGTGGLAGLRGSGTAVASSDPGGTFAFEYELG